MAKLRSFPRMGYENLSALEGLPNAPPPYDSFPSCIGTKRITLICPYCQEHVRTKVKRQSTVKTHVVACALFFTLCWICCFVPYCMDSCRNATHYCPNCDLMLGSYQS